VHTAEKLNYSTPELQPAFTCDLGNERQAQFCIDQVLKLACPPLAHSGGSNFPGQGAGKFIFPVEVEEATGVACECFAQQATVDDDAVG